MTLLLPLTLGTLLAAEAAPPARHDLDQLLARPPSPGAVVLLTPYVGSAERAAGRVFESLTHADPAVRASAARVAYVNGMRAALSTLRRALPEETDRTAAIEMMRAVAALGGPDGDAALQPLAERHRAKQQLERAVLRGTVPEPAGDDRPRTRILIAAPLPPGALRDALAITGCKPEKGLLGAALVDYRPDGRPRTVSIASAPMRRECQAVAVAALSLALAPPAAGKGDALAGRNIVFVALDPDAVACGGEPEPRDIQRLAGDRAARPIKEPRKVKHANPEYPSLARSQRRQGVVILEAVVSDSGCIRSLAVLNSASPDLDMAALRAVSQWRYTPTLLDGEPVTIVMTVTVSFRLG
jgi:TonB family protein